MLSLGHVQNSAVKVKTKFSQQLLIFNLLSVEGDNLFANKIVLVIDQTKRIGAKVESGRS